MRNKDMIEGPKDDEHRVSIKEFLTKGPFASSFILFFAPDTTRYTEEVLALEKPSRHHANPYADWILEIADCGRPIRLELSTDGSKKDFAESLGKVDTLLDGLTKLREALLAERKLYQKRRNYVNKRLGKPKED